MRAMSSRIVPAVLRIALKIVDVGIFKNDYVPYWFKFGLVIDTTKLCILVLAFVTLTLIQGHKGAR